MFTTKEFYTCGTFTSVQQWQKTYMRPSSFPSSLSSSSPSSLCVCVSGSGGKYMKGTLASTPMDAGLGVVLRKPLQPYNYRDGVWTPCSANNCSLFAKSSPGKEMSKQTSRGCEEKAGRIIIMIYACTILQAIY